MQFDIYALIEKIRPRPALYLGKNSVSLLNAFLGGYMTAAYDAQISFVDETPPFGAFHDWVAMKLGYYESTSGWANMLLAAEGQNEAKALERFFVYLDEFKQRKAKLILQAVPDATKSWRYQIVDDEKINLPSPVLVQIVKYTDDRGVFVRHLDENGALIDREEYHQDLDVAFSCEKWFIEKNAWKQPET